MNGNDREMLAYAAKAANLRVDEDFDLLDFRETWGAPKPWRPLDDDGDAFRLAVALDIHISLYGPDTGITTWVMRDRAISFHADYGDDHCASVRRSIVRAAAYIGGKMP